MKARLPQGYGKAPANNMNSMIKQAQKMQEELAKKQAELDEMEFSTTAGGGVVTVVMNGKKEMKSLTIKPEIVNADDIEMLQDLIMAATNKALRTIEEKTAQEMDKITGGLNIPGLM